MSATTTQPFGPNYRALEVGKIATLRPAAPLRLTCGVELAEFPLAYQTYGELNANKSNAILICHGLTGDQYAASPHPVTSKPGWWNCMIGPNKAIDTNRFFVIATNVLGGCMGSFGPKSINPETGKAYGINFPVITIADMVNAQTHLIDHLGIAQLYAVVGGSMGGMQVLEWAVSHPTRVARAIPIATAARHSAQNIGFHEIGRQAIMADPHWAQGHYYATQQFPSKGLAVARMTAHVTYMSEVALQQKFGRGLQGKDSVGFGFDADFQIESYLHHQGHNFVERFDPNSYLYITRAMDYFDLAGQGRNLAQCFQDTPVRFCIISFSSDWCFPPEQSRTLIHALNAAAANVSYAEIESDRGHDAFLLNIPAMHEVIGGFLGR